MTEPTIRQGIRGQTVALWHPDSVRDAVESRVARKLLSGTRVPGVKLHAGPSALTGPYNPPRSRRDRRSHEDFMPAVVRGADIVRGMCPESKIHVGVGYDGIAHRVRSREWTVQRAIDRGLEVASMAHEARAVALEYDPEAAWKVAENSWEWGALADVARGTIAAVRSAFPSLEQGHTSYDHILYHPQDRRPDRDDPGVYNWAAWCGDGGVDFAEFQVYAGDGDDDPATFTSHAGAVARFKRHEEQLAEAVQRGWIRPDLGPGGPGCCIYVQAHSVATSGSVYLASQRSKATGSRRHVSWWAPPKRCDARGLAALQIALELEAGGYIDRHGPDAVKAWQTDHPVYAGRPDGIAGPKTYAAMGLSPVDPT